MNGDSGSSDSNIVAVVQWRAKNRGGSEPRPLLVSVIRRKLEGSVEVKNFGEIQEKTSKSVTNLHTV